MIWGPRHASSCGYPGRRRTCERAPGSRSGFPRSLWLAAELLITGRDTELLHRWRVCAGQLDIPMVASGNVHMHRRARRALQDTVTAIRLKTPLEKAGFGLYSNGERFLRPIDELTRLYPEDLLRETLAIAERVDFFPGRAAL